MKRTPCTRLFYLAIVMAFFSQTPLYGEWAPPVTVFNALSTQNPNVGVDANGNAVIIATVSDDLADFYPRAVQLVNGVPQKPQNFPTQGFIYKSCELAVNASGNAAAAWMEFDTFSFTYLLRSALLTQNSWSPVTPLSDPALFSMQYSALPRLHLSASNQVLAFWPSQNLLDASFHIHTNRFNTSWIGEQAILSTADMSTSSALAGIPSGEAMALWSQNNPLMLQAAYYDGTIWNVTDLSTDLLQATSAITAVAMNNSRHALLLWNDQSTQGISSIAYANTLYGMPQSVYVPPANHAIQSLKVTFDAYDRGIALWISKDSNNNDYFLMTSQYANGIWENPRFLDTAQNGEQLAHPNLNIDADGNAYAVWEKDNPAGKGVIYSNHYTQANRTWDDLPTLLSNPDETSTNPKLSMNATGQATAVWCYGNLKNQIHAAFTKNPNKDVPLAPLPPTNFKGKQVKIEFLLQYDLVNILKWSASPDPHVVCYHLFRNDTKIATISASSPLTYEDHKRVIKKKDVYKLTAVNGEGIESTPISLTM
ncbi:MAG: hypothetical protein CK425_02085 [Parachlamydia sp.]|nr:MAG: hypothetical protein CK425_02085 [Parachlamydia sp.]